MSAVESTLIDQYRRREEADITTGYVMQCFPLCSIIVTS